jgi:DNA-binding MarR family transcriptional regulator
VKKTSDPGRGFDLRDSTGYLINRLAVSFKTALERELAYYEVTAQQWALMQALAQLEAATVVTLAGWLGVDVGAASRLIDRLEEKQLVTRRRTRTDGRIAEVTLTVPGRALMPHLVSQAEKVLAEALRPLAPDETATLNALLRRLLAGLEG